jgi:hypothetical protein
MVAVLETGSLIGRSKAKIKLGKHGLMVFAGISVKKTG